MAAVFEGFSGVWAAEGPWKIWMVGVGVQNSCWFMVDVLHCMVLLCNKRQNSESSTDVARRPLTRQGRPACSAQVGD